MSDEKIPQWVTDMVTYAANDENAGVWGHLARKIFLTFFVNKDGGISIELHGPDVDENEVDLAPESL